MKLSTRGRYGLRLMFDLAEHYGQGPIFLKDIAERQEISERYLWNLVTPLKSCGLVSSKRGARGGYELARHPDEIRIKDILTVLEGPMCLVDCVEAPASCSRSGNCVSRELWLEASQSLEHIFERTLGDALRKARA